jgi:hypothetical protein
MPNVPPAFHYLATVCSIRLAEREKVSEFPRYGNVRMTVAQMAKHRRSGPLMSTDQQNHLSPLIHLAPSSGGRRQLLPVMKRVERRIPPRARQEFLMRAALDQLSLFHDENPIRQTDHGKTMRNQDRCSSLG